MKSFKNFMTMVVAALTLGVAFSSCSKDDDEPVIAPPAAKEIAGTYTDKVTVTVMNQNSEYENQTVTVTAENDEEVTIVIPGVGEGAMKLPEIPVKGLKVTGANGTYAIGATEFVGATDAGKSYTGTIAATYKDKQLTVNLSLQYGAMPMPMVFKFTGIKK